MNERNENERQHAYVGIPLEMFVNQPKGRYGCDRGKECRDDPANLDITYNVF